MLAERVGFEPTLGYPKPVFKTGAINHSTTSPGDVAFAEGYVFQQGATVKREAFRDLEQDSAGHELVPSGLMVFEPTVTAVQYPPRPRTA